MIQGLNHGGGKIFCTHPTCLQRPPSLLYNRCWVSFPEVKWPEHGVDHTLQFSSKVKHRQSCAFASSVPPVACYVVTCTFTFPESSFRSPPPQNVWLTSEWCLWLHKNISILWFPGKLEVLLTTWFFCILVGGQWPSLFVQLIILLELF
jgi:hypothetical protein